MERIIKIIILCLIVFFPCRFATAETTPQPSMTVTPQMVTLPQCIKTFNVGYEKLFLLTESAISANNFIIDEVQTQGGYIVFSVSQYKFLASVFTFGTNKAILKITPCNNNYMFPPAIIKNIFRYIESNQYKKY